MKMKVVSVMLLFIGLTAASAEGHSKYAKEIVATGGFIQTPISDADYVTSGHDNAGGPDFTVAAAHTVDAVVHVMTKIMPSSQDMSNGMQQDPFFNFFFGMPDNPRRMEPQMASGSGVIISTDGYIVTNNHVVAGSNNIEVVLNDKRKFDATVVGTDPNTDLALLKINAKNLPTIVFGNSDDLKVGQWVLAVGNPFNLTSTVTAGIVSAKGRNINIISSKMPIESFIQTDAAINPGNSGGALVNTKGELVGINTAIASETGTYDGYGFAIPVNIVKKVVADLKKYGVVQRAVLGVTIQDINADLAKKKDLKTLNGAYVAGVEDGSAAKDAGILEGDVITKINDITVNSVADLQGQISQFHPGDKISVTINRAGKVKTIEATLHNASGGTKLVQNKGLEALGASFEEINNTLKQQLNISGGVQVVSLQEKSVLAQAGVKKGLVIVKIDNEPVYSISQLQAIVNHINNASARDHGLFITGIYPNGEVAYYAIDLSK
ncbi:Do family serine endopeptidase [Microbacter margulisiae]|uniref:Do/DeqQ family serine protease n=1 Tax=Microbacter margulisiae TaxID=1350067 RepID=A0A7W5DTG3_9PORP|nr:Do family serine endopeptidase [Microbacter margulisiae]MBB3187933.1 Do/DeqQ family serine protease [Microbacter margulisiae]